MKLDVRGMEEVFGRLGSSDKTIDILGDRWWPPRATQDRDRISKQLLWNIRKRILSAQMLEVSLD